VLRGSTAIVSTVIGATAAPIVAAFTIDGSCETGSWIVLALVISAIWAFGIAGIAAFVGDRIGDRPWFERNRARVLPILIALGLLGVAGWIAFAARATPCG
jgi:Kef-type K+ transport system membrane component KefB